VRVTDEDPTWEMLLKMLDHGGLTGEGKAAARWSLEWLRDLLGPSWLPRQYRRMGRLPGELLMFATHQYGLPSLLFMVTRLRAVVGVEPTFAPVMTGLRRGLDSAGWRHLLLQLEAARAFRSPGATVTFEPAIPGSDSKADLRIEDGAGIPWLVETTALFRSRLDRDAEEYEDRFQWAVRAVEHRHRVHCITHLDDHLDQQGTQEWLSAVDAAARQVRAAGVSQTVATEAGRVRIQVSAPAGGATVFAGVLRSGDGWRRLGRAIRDKARQSAGPVPVWLRIDVLDGLFQFTEWSGLPWPERIEHVSVALRGELRGVQHLHGVVLSSGPAVALGAVERAQEDITAKAQGGTGIRRLIVPHLVRETLVITLHDSAAEQAAAWINAYAAEPDWLDEDLAQLGQQPSRSFWPS